MYESKPVEDKKSFSIGLPSETKYNANPGPGAYQVKSVKVDLSTT